MRYAVLMTATGFAAVEVIDGSGVHPGPTEVCSTHTDRARAVEVAKRNAKGVCFEAVSS